MPGKMLIITYVVSVVEILYLIFEHLSLFPSLLYLLVFNLSLVDKAFAHWGEICWQCNCVHSYNAAVRWWLWWLCWI